MPDRYTAKNTQNLDDLQPHTSDNLNLLFEKTHHIKIILEELYIHYAFKYKFIYQIKTFHTQFLLHYTAAVEDNWIECYYSKILFVYKMNT